MKKLLLLLHRYKIYYPNHYFVYRSYKEYCIGKVSYEYGWKECKICGYEPQCKYIK